MNPMTNVKNIIKLNERELSLGVSNKTSWHNQYKDSAWIFVGGLAYDLTEGDVICVFSQYGEIVNINLVRDKKTGKSKGYCFICYEDQKSTILAVDNLNGIKLLGRTIRVDHVAEYKPPKDRDEDDLLTKQLHTKGCAPEIMTSLPLKESKDDVKTEKQAEKKHRKSKKKRKKSKHKSHSNKDSDSNHGKHKQVVKVKKEKIDSGYEKYDNVNQAQNVKKSKRSESEKRVSRDSNPQKRQERRLDTLDVSDAKRTRLSPENEGHGKPEQRHTLFKLTEKSSKTQNVLSLKDNKKLGRHDSSNDTSSDDEGCATKLLKQSSSPEDGSSSSGSSSSDSDSVDTSKGRSAQPTAGPPHSTSHHEQSRDTSKERYDSYVRKYVNEGARQSRDNMRHDWDIDGDRRNERYRRDEERDRNRGRYDREDEISRRIERRYDERDWRSSRRQFYDDDRSRRYNYKDDRDRRSERRESSERRDTQRHYDDDRRQNWSRSNRR